MPEARTMLAHVLHGAKDLRLQTVPRPLPGPGEVLVAVRAAGICGSDLHYYTHGRCGNFIPSRPFIPGHEFAGEVVAYGAGVDAPAIGTLVAVDPSRACGRCRPCRQGQYNLCPHMVYFGSASVDPPSDGCFAEFVTVPARNCWPLPTGFDASLGALLEPLSVAMHAVNRSGGVGGKSVLITGGGTIGQMILLVATAFGASCVVVSDPRPFARETARQHGAAMTLNPKDPDASSKAWGPAGTGFEVVFEAAGAASALDLALRHSAPGATVVQVGTLPDGTDVPVNTLLTRELRYVGSWRFANVFERVMEMIHAGRIQPKHLITRVYPFENLNEGIAEAASGGDVLKVQIARLG